MVELTENQEQKFKFHSQILDKIKKTLCLDSDSHISPTSNKPAAIAEMYKAFCETEIASEKTVTMEERIAWLEYMKGDR